MELNTHFRLELKDWSNLDKESIESLNERVAKSERNTGLANDTIKVLNSAVLNIEKINL